MKPTKQTSPTPRSLPGKAAVGQIPTSIPLTIRIGKDAGTDEIWVSQQLGAKKDPRTYLTLANLSLMALEFEALGDEEAAAFVRRTVDRIERSSLLETVETSYCFPGEP